MAMAEAVQSDGTAIKQRNIEPYKFQPGQSGNPAGRPKGARSKLSEDFIGDLHQHWQTNGKAAISKLYKQDIATYCRIIAGMIPKDINLNVSAAERFSQIIEHIEQQANGGGQDGGQPIAPPTDLPVISSTYETGQADGVSAIPTEPAPQKAQD